MLQRSYQQSLMSCISIFHGLMSYSKVMKLSGLLMLNRFSACRKKLIALYDKSKGVGGTRGSRLKWPLGSKDHKESIQELTSSAQWTQSVFQLVRNIGARAQSIQQSLKKQAQKSKILHAAEERERILDWISAIKHEQTHLHVRRPRVDGTGEWCLQKGEFRNWRDEPNEVFWGYGIQGSGKTPGQHSAGV